MPRPTLTAELSRFVLPLLQFDGLCLRAQDTPTVAAFWAAALGGTINRVDASQWRVDPGSDRPHREILRVDAGRVPQADASRVHLDIRLAGADPHHLVDAGARLLRRPGPDPWFVLADPEGNQFCAFPAVDERPAGIFQLVVKCRQPLRLARWWGAVLDGEVTVEGEAAVVTGAPDFPWDYLVFDPVPEAKVAPSRMHWHVTLREPDPALLVAIGATVLRGPQDAAMRWVLADPEGNEFCAVAPAAHPA